ncbi:MAG: class I SAM-dependent methyltransferase [Candidatus Binatia bacterium]
MGWKTFEKAASRYEAWYSTPHGQRADQAERALLQWLLTFFPGARSLLEIGCGTGHFAEWLASMGLWVVGLDRSPAMLVELHKRTPELRVILSDAHSLPLRDRAVDLTTFVTTVEFLDHAETALKEAVRVSRQGLILVVLNRWSLGGLSRRWGPQARGLLLGQAHDYSLLLLRTLLKQAGGTRVQRVQWTSSLFPAGLWRLQAPLPFGDVIGMAAVFSGS